MAIIGIATLITLLFTVSCKKKTVEPIDTGKRQIILVPNFNSPSNYYWINPPHITYPTNSDGRPNGTSITVNVGDTILVKITKTSQNLTPGCQVFQDGVEQNWFNLGPNTTDFTALYIVKK